MADQMEAFDIESVRSRISELSGVLRDADDFASLSASDSESLFRECVQSLEAQVEQIVSEYSDVQFLKENDLSLCLEQLTAELKTTEAENGDLCNEIEELKQTHMASACELEGELESLNYALDNFKRLDHKEVRERASVDGSNDGGTCRFSKEHEEQNFQELDLNYQIERSSATLKELQDLDHMLKKYEAIEKIEECFSGLKVIEFEGNHIRLSLKTYIPYVEGLMHHQKLRDTVETSELNHELQIEVKSGSMELKNAEIFPNDVYIGDIFEAITSFSSHTDLAIVQTSSSLRWFLQKVQDRIGLCSLRQFMVKIANRSRHSLEYMDRDELIMASIIGIDAFIKPSQGWPLSTSVLKLISLKPSDHDAEEISLRLLCEIESDSSMTRSLTAKDEEGTTGVHSKRMKTMSSRKQSNNQELGPKLDRVLDRVVVPVKNSAQNSTEFWTELSIPAESLQQSRTRPKTRPSFGPSCRPGAELVQQSGTRPSSGPSRGPRQRSRFVRFVFC